MKGLRQTRYRRPPYRTTSTRERLGASSRFRRVLAQHRRDCPPAVDPAQLDLSADHQAKEQNQRRLFARQGTLCLHAAPELLMEPLNRVRGSQCLPLNFGEAEEREELSPPSPQARYHARAVL